MHNGIPEVAEHRIKKYPQIQINGLMTSECIKEDNHNIHVIIQTRVNDISWQHRLVT